MRLKHQTASALLLTGLLLGCSTPNPQPSYHLLSSQLSHHPCTEPQQPLQLSLSTAEYLRSNALILELASQELYFAPNHLWAEPLEAGISRTLSHAYNQRCNGHYLLSERSLLNPTASTPTLTIEIDRLHTIDRDAVILTGRYRLPNTTQIHEFNYRSPLTQSGYPHAVNVMQQLLVKLGNELATK